MLTVDTIHKTFETPQRPLEVLRGVSFQMARGESIALMGESGSGKSTLLHIIAGLEPLDAGSVKLDGVDLTGLKDHERAAFRRDNLSLIFQQFNLITSMTVADNLSFEAKLANRLDKAWLEALTEKLGLQEFLNRYPEELSGGQQQRVAIGRTFAAKPALILADEPTGNLDDGNSQRFLDMAFGLVAETNCSLLMVTHSAEIAARTDRQLHLRSGQLS